jgi:hypothetical protein
VEKISNIKYIVLFKHKILDILCHTIYFISVSLISSSNTTFKDFKIQQKSNGRFDENDIYKIVKDYI